MFYSNNKRRGPACDRRAAKYTVRVYLPRIETEESYTVPYVTPPSTIPEYPGVGQSVDPHCATDPTAPSMVPRDTEFDSAEEPALCVESAAPNSPSSNPVGG